MIIKKYLLKQANLFKYMKDEIDTNIEKHTGVKIRVNAIKT